MRATVVPLFLPVLLASLTGRTLLRAQAAPLRQPLDSGAVVRLTWRADGRELARLVAPLGPKSDSVRFCRAPVAGCGLGSVNPVRSRPAGDLARVEVPHGSHLLTGALGGAAVGTLFGLYMLGALNADETHPGTGRKLAAVGFAFGVPTAIGAMAGSGGHDWIDAP
jgi:hypothetical protein